MTVALNHPNTDGLPEIHAPTGHLRVLAEQTAWSDDQRAALAQIGLADAPDGDLKVFMHYCQRTGLDPFAGQIYMIKRYDWQSQSDKWTIQVGIGGFRLIADDHPEYAGQEPPEWCGEDGKWRDVWLSKTPPAAARVKVIRRDWDLPAVGIVLFSEYAQTKKGGGLTSMWATKGAHQLAKCAEAFALRKAFPQRLSGVYAPEEDGFLEQERRRGRTVVTQPPVTSDELRGVAPGPATELPAAEPPPAAGRPASQQQMKRLFATIRDHGGISDRLAWATQVLGREVTSFGQLTGADASTLIDTLTADTTPAETTAPPADTNPTTPDQLDQLWAQILAAAPEGWDTDRVEQDFAGVTKTTPAHANAAAMRSYLEHLQDR